MLVQQDWYLSNIRKDLPKSILNPFINSGSIPRPNCRFLIGERADLVQRVRGYNMILTLLDGKKIFINLRTKVIKTIFETEEGTAIDFTDFSQHIVKETFAQVVKLQEEDV